MSELDIFKESTQQEILQELKAQKALVGIIAKGYDINSWDAAFEIGRSGAANKILTVGDQLVGKYINGSSEYSCPWDVVGFLPSAVAMVNGAQKTFYNVPIIQMHYTGHENQPFDPAEAVEATEETAQAGFYYCGYDGTNYTMLTLAEGATIPYSTYTKVYKTIYNSANAIRYGNSEWQYSWFRQYLNNSGTGWATPQHACDVLPNNAANITGFMSYIDEDLASNVHAIKIKTKQASYTGSQLIETFDKFFPLSISEMNMKHSAASPDDGEPLDYYKILLESTVKKDTGTYAALIKYAVNGTTSAQYVRLRSALLSGNNVWSVKSSGYVSTYNPTSAYRPAPACALI